MVEQKNYGIKGLLKYVEGDATVPIAAGHRMIIHVVNTAGGFGAGFVLALKKWPNAELIYRTWYRSQLNFKLGEIKEVAVQSDTSVIHMLAQEGLGPDKDGNPPGRYDAVEKCLEKVAKLAKQTNASIHCPRFSSGLSGLSWPKIEAMIIDKLINQGVNVTVYDLPKKKI